MSAQDALSVNRPPWSAETRTSMERSLAEAEAMIEQERREPTPIPVWSTSRLNWWTDRADRLRRALARDDLARRAASQEEEKHLPRTHMGPPVTASIKATMARRIGNDMVEITPENRLLIQHIDRVELALKNELALADELAAAARNLVESAITPADEPRQVDPWVYWDRLNAALARHFSARVGEGGNHVEAG